MKVKIIKFENFYKAPERKHSNDAGADCYLPKNTLLRPRDTVVVDLGFGIEVPIGYAAYTITRSSICAKGINVAIPPVDSGYTGPIHAVLTNMGEETLQLHEGDRICQLVIMPVIVADFVDDLGDERGSGAFGSTGK